MVYIDGSTVYNVPGWFDVAKCSGGKWFAFASLDAAGVDNYCIDSAGSRSKNWPSFSTCSCN